MKPCNVHLSSVYQIKKLLYLLAQLYVGQITEPHLQNNLIGLLKAFIRTFILA